MSYIVNGGFDQQRETRVLSQFLRFLCTYIKLGCVVSGRDLGYLVLCRVLLIKVIV